MYQALYRKYRPKNLDEVAGQSVILKILSNSIKNNKISHAYLFCGPRGTGKTSVAKIMAKILNCKNLNDMKPCDNCDSCIQFNNKNNTDIIEIDAASNNGVDEIRELKNKVNLVPNLGKYKIYIIDEVHMLTIGAFNALLKTLEEPPSHAIFILATTEPHKIPITILSRCQRLDFKKITISEISQRLKTISDIENIKITDSAINRIAQLCDGGLRDSISMLDKLVAYTDNDINQEDVDEINGLITEQQIEKFYNFIQRQDYKEIFDMIDYFNENGKNFTKLSEEIIIYLRNLLIENLNSNVNHDENKKIINYIESFSEIINLLKNASDSKIIFETNIVKMMIPSFNDEQKNYNIQIKENKEIIKIENYQALEENKKVENDIYEYVNKLKNVRVNNTLASFNKKILLEYKQKLENISKYIIDPDYSDIAGLILDGELKAASLKNLIFVFQSDNIAFDFNVKLLDIENLLNKLGIQNVKAIATDMEDWNVIKEKYNSKSEKYEYIDDENLIRQIFWNKKEVEEKNSIESVFNDIIKYEK